MTTSTIEIEAPMASTVVVDYDQISVELVDGRKLTVPLSWYPRLVHANEEERLNFQLIGDGTGLHWPDVAEDLSVASMIAGRPSMESKKSFQQWLSNRATDHNND